MSELAAMITALGALLTAFAAAAWKIWRVIDGVNDQLEEIATEATKRRKEAEKENSTLKGELMQLRAETAALRDEVHELRTELASRDEELEELVELRVENDGLQQAVDDLEARLIKESNRADHYQKLWRERQEEK